MTILVGGKHVTECLIILYITESKHNILHPLIKVVDDKKEKNSINISQSNKTNWTRVGRLHSVYISIRFMIQTDVLPANFQLAVK